MDVESKNLDDLAMDYFDGIEWIAWQHVAKCKAWVDKGFPDYWVLCYAQRGTLSLQLDDGPVELVQGPAAWLVWPGPRFRFGNQNLKDLWEHRYISFRGERASRFVQGGLFPVGSQMPLFRIRDAEGFALEMDRAISKLNSGASLEAVHLLEGLLLSLRFPKLNPVRTDPPSEKLQALALSIHEDPAREWDFRKIARSLGISYTHFRRRFVALQGQPPLHFTMKARLDKAAEALRSSCVSVKEAAALSGYGDIHYFSRIFRTVYGLPPAKYGKRFNLFS